MSRNGSIHLAMPTKPSFTLASRKGTWYCVGMHTNFKAFHDLLSPAQQAQLVTLRDVMCDAQERSKLDHQRATANADDSPVPVQSGG